MTVIDPFLIIQEYHGTPPVNVYALIDKLGIQLSFHSMNDDISGTIERKKNSRYLIRINSEHSKTRQRFTAAHELGHYMYHRKQIDMKAIGDTRMYRTLTGYNDQIDTKEETQANQFAANLLMPRDIIIDFKNKGLTSDQIAEKLEVSKQAMNIRYKAIFNKLS